MSIDQLSAFWSETVLAFPSLLQVITSVVLLAVGVPIVYLLSKVLKIHPKPITIAEPRKEVALASIVIVALFVLVFVWRTLTYMFRLEPPEFTSDITSVLWRSVLAGVGFLIVALAMRSTRQKLGSIGISKNDIGRMVALGLILSIMFLTLSGLLTTSLGGGITSFSSSWTYGLIETAIIGFSEEILWRGYIQTRLIAYGGTIKGLVVTSLLFAILWHFPLAYYYETSGVVLEAMVWASFRVFPGLLFGYIMLKSQNIIPSSIFHLFYNWSLYLWRIS
jgi:membrane protease YdiL (CAAX protease family)